MIEFLHVSYSGQVVRLLSFLKFLGFPTEPDIRLWHFVGQDQEGASSCPLLLQRSVWLLRRHSGLCFAGSGCFALSSECTGVCVDSCLLVWPSRALCPQSALKGSSLRPCTWKLCCYLFCTVGFLRAFPSAGKLLSRTAHLPSEGECTFPPPIKTTQNKASLLKMP